MIIDIFNNKILWVVILVGVLIIVGIIGWAVFFNDTEEVIDAGNSVASNSQNNGKKTNSNSKKNWPDLKEYEIAELSDGKIENVQNNGTVNGYKFNYTIDVESITEDEIEKYVKQFF